MKPLPLLPARYRTLGILLFALGFLGWLLEMANILPGYDALYDETDIVFLLATAGGAIAAFSRTRQEDEFVQHLRLRALFWSLRLQVILVISIYYIPFPYEGFFSGTKLGMTIFQQAGFFLWYLLRFHYLLARTRRLEREEAAA